MFGLENLLKGMGDDKLMELALKSGILNKFTGKLKELLEEIAQENNAEITKCGIMIKMSPPLPPPAADANAQAVQQTNKKDEKKKDDVYFYVYVGGKAIARYTLEELIREGQKKKTESGTT